MKRKEEEEGGNRRLLCFFGGEDSSPVNQINSHVRARKNTTTNSGTRADWPDLPSITRANTAVGAPNLRVPRIASLVPRSHLPDLPRRKATDPPQSRTRPEKHSRTLVDQKYFRTVHLLYCEHVISKMRNASR